MTSSYIIYADKEINNITQYHKGTYRSNFYISKVKHCFEATLNNGCENIHIGFSPVSSGRNFISLWKSSQVVFLERASDSSQLSHNIDATMMKGETFMVCLDSTNKRFMSIIGDKTNEVTYSIMQSSEAWYAITDASNGCTNTPSNIGVNLGMKKFKNKMPQGFKQLIYGYSLYKFKCQQRITLMRKRYYSNIFYIAMVILANK